MANLANSVGDFGELLAATHLSRPVGGRFKRPLFRPIHLGAKYPTVDYLVDILDASDTSVGFFFVQVKSTSAANPRSKVLSIDVPSVKFNRLVRIPVPTFVIGVDTQSEKAFLVAAHRAIRGRLRRISKTHELTSDRTRVSLYKEVLKFWTRCRPLLRVQSTQFTNER